MELIKILPDPIQFPCIYDFTFIFFGNNGEIRIHVRLLEDEAVKHAKHDLADAKEPKLLARFKWYSKAFDIPLIEELYQLDFNQEPVVLLRIYEETNKEPDLLVIFINEDKKFWLHSWKNDRFHERTSFLTLDEAERHIAKEVYYNKKQVLFVCPEILGEDYI